MSTFRIITRAGAMGTAIPRAILETRWSLACAIIAVVLTIGCGGSDSSPTDPGNPPPPPPPPPPPTVATVTVTPASDTLAGVGDTTRLSATARDAGGNVMTSATFIWSSSNQTVASVNAAGLVTAVAAGSATISASSGAITGSASILVLPPSTLAVGAWTGFTSQNNAIGFVVSSTNQVSRLGLAINVSTPFVTCIVPFNGSAAGVSLTAGAFADSISGGVGLSNRVPVTGSRTSANQVTGSVGGYSGTFAVFCGGSLSIGTGTLWSTFSFDARPVIPAGTDLTFKLLTSGALHTCGLTNSGVAYCWGENGSGQLGDASTFDKNVPTQVVGSFTFATISAGNNHTCALTTAGAAYCWGDNTNGRLGDGTTTNRLVPTAVAGGLVFASIRAPSNTCALTTAGAAWCWGNNTNGSVGDGTNTHRNQPTAVIGGHTYASLGGGSSSTCGITTSGATYCWGENGSGQLGDGTKTHRNQPVQVLGGLTFKFIGTGRASHTCGITTSDDLYCWGENEDGQIGDSTTTDRTQPVPVASGQKFSFVSVAAANGSGSDHTCAVRTDGTGYCWGGDDYGKTGRGAVAGRSLTPLEIFGGISLAQVSAGGDHSCGLSRTGVTYCWGRNSSGQTGLGKFLGLTNYPLPLLPRY